MRIRVKTEESLKWIVSRDMTRTEEDLRTLGEGELSSKIRIREEGSDTSPQLIELEYEPHAEIQIHAHNESEIIFIREGELHLGSRVIGPGASIFVAGNTLYGFKAGPNGLRILNFRPRKDVTFITREEFLEQKVKLKGLSG